MRSLLTLVCVLLAVSLSRAVEVIPASRAREFVGKVATIEGTVTATRNEGRNTFLSLGPADAPELTVAITPPLLLSGFPPQPEKFYQGKTIRVNGAIYMIQGRPEVLVSDADRISVVSEAESAAIQEALRLPAPSASGPNPTHNPTAPLSRDLLIGKETRMLDLRPSSPQADTNLTAQAADACGEAQALWRQVTQDLVPHLRAYTICLEKGSLGCDPEGEKVALGMLGVQQAQKRVKATCR